jgi:hypothetical protein
VWLRPGAWLLVHDEITGRGSHSYEANFQFAPGTLQDLGGAVRFDGAIDIRWTSPASWTSRVAAGGRGPADGWIAESLGVLVAAPRLTLTCTSDAPPTHLLVVLAQTGGAADGDVWTSVREACEAHRTPGDGAEPDFAMIQELASRAAAAPQ